MQKNSTPFFTYSYFICLNAEVGLAHCPDYTKKYGRANMGVRCSVYNILILSTYHTRRLLYHTRSIQRLPYDSMMLCR